jgi:Tol biopolymer transport system component
MSTITERLSLALADRYRIERQLGAGGMATVYLAHDVKHDRKVAVKVLKPELAAVLGAERFVVEIKTTASLQHPHILPLFDSGTADGFLFYVMPYVEGETLRTKLDRETQLGIDESIRIATEVADALHYAHQHGVIHRDIKPENILIQNGRPMVADFGIALAVSAAAGGRMTETGLSLGTPHYMSPEQATAEKEITGRSDIYSLASVLYEMLAGEPPHMGNSAQQIIMKIIADTPRPVSELRKSVPAHVATAVAQALEKLPADRFASAADFAAAIEGRLATRATAATVASSGTSRRWRALAMGLGVATLVFATLFGWSFTRVPSVPSAGLVEFSLSMGRGIDDRALIDISRDGRKIIQSVADSDGVAYLAIRDLGSTTVTPIPGTGGAIDAAFSPNGQWIAFQSSGKLRKVLVTGGPPSPIADSIHAGGTWFGDSVIIYTKSNEGLWRVSANGGTPERLTSLDRDRREFNHWYPQVLPGGKAVIFNSFSTPLARSRIEAVDLATGVRTVLVDGAVFPRYVASGHLLYGRDAAIFAVPFDPVGLRVLGPGVPVVEDVAWSLTNGAAGFDVSDNGTLAYIKASEWQVESRVVWADRTGLERPAMTEIGKWAEPRISPDRRWFTITRDEGDRQLWLYDRTRRTISQLTRSQGVSFSAAWTPDSRAVIHTVETPVYDLMRTPIDGRAPDTLRVTPFDKFVSSVSSDGRTMAYLEVVDRDRQMIASLAGGEARAVGEPANHQRNGAFSPDGKWLAFEEVGPDGRSEVFVRPLEERGGRRQVSAGGGSQPRWTKGGKEIVYRRGGAMLAVSFQPTDGEAGRPVLLFTKPDAGRLGQGRTTGYDVTADGNEFLLVVPIERPDATPVVVVLNWLDELRRKVPR